MIQLEGYLSQINAAMTLHAATVVRSLLRFACFAFFKSDERCILSLAVAPTILLPAIDNREKYY